MEAQSLNLGSLLEKIKKKTLSQSTFDNSFLINMKFSIGQIFFNHLGKTCLSQQKTTGSPKTLYGYILPL